MSPWRSTLVAVAVLSFAGCTGESADDGRFDRGEVEGELECMEHQAESPGTDYTGGTEADTAAILGMFRYYVDNGDKPYCDGDPPSDTDRDWAQLVVDLGGSEESVAPILEAAE